MVILPVTALVRPTAAWDWPKRVSCTRYPASDPVVTFQTPSTVDGVPDDLPDPVGRVEEPSDDRLSGAGAGPSMKWKNTNGPPTTRITTNTTAAMSQRRQRRLMDRITCIDYLLRPDSCRVG